MLGFRVTKRVMLLIAMAVLLVACPFTSAHAQADDPLALMGQVTSFTREGKLAEAIEASKRLLAAIEKMAGKQHPLYLAQIAWLGDLHAMKGDNAQAERFNLQALALREKILGREHADVASSLASLAKYLKLPATTKRKPHCTGAGHTQEGAAGVAPRLRLHLCESRARLYVALALCRCGAHAPSGARPSHPPPAAGSHLSACCREQSGGSAPRPRSFRRSGPPAGGSLESGERLHGREICSPRR